MTLEEQIKTLCVRSSLSVSALAKRLGNSPQNFHAKMKRESFTKKDMEDIARATNSTYKQVFILENGEQIT